MYEKQETEVERRERRSFRKKSSSRRKAGNGAHGRTVSRQTTLGVAGEFREGRWAGDKNLLGLSAQAKGENIGM